MGQTVRNDKKTEFLKFRVSQPFKEKILNMKSKTPGCMEMDLQQFVVRLIELGLLAEEDMGKKERESCTKEHDTPSSNVG